MEGDQDARRAERIDYEVLARVIDGPWGNARPMVEREIATPDLVDPSDCIRRGRWGRCVLSVVALPQVVARSRARLFGSEAVRRSVVKGGSPK